MSLIEFDTMAAQTQTSINTTQTLAANSRCHQPFLIHSGFAFIYFFDIRHMGENRLSARCYRVSFLRIKWVWSLIPFMITTEMTPKCRMSDTKYLWNILASLFYNGSKDFFVYVQCLFLLFILIFSALVGGLMPQKRVL